MIVDKQTVQDDIKGLEPSPLATAQVSPLLVPSLVSVSPTHTLALGHLHLQKQYHLTSWFTKEEN